MGTELRPAVRATVERNNKDRRSKARQDGFRSEPSQDHLGALRDRLPRSRGRLGLRLQSAGPTPRPNSFGSHHGARSACAWGAHLRAQRRWLRRGDEQEQVHDLHLLRFCRPLSPASSPSLPLFSSACPGSTSSSRPCARTTLGRTAPPRFPRSRPRCATTFTSSGASPSASASSCWASSMPPSSPSASPRGAPTKRSLLTTNQRLSLFLKKPM